MYASWRIRFLAAPTTFLGRGLGPGSCFGIKLIIHCAPVVRYVVATVQAADQIGLPLCITLVVGDPSVVAVEQVHTGRNLGVWPSPSGQVLPAGPVFSSFDIQLRASAFCHTYNGTDFEVDIDGGPHGGCRLLFVRLATLS